MANTEVGLSRPRGGRSSSPTGSGAGTARRSLTAGRLCLVEARPSVLVVFLLRFLAGGAMTGQLFHSGQLPRTAAAALVWELAVFSIYLFNGVMDVHEDRVNGSRRPIASGALPRPVAAWAAGGAAAASIAGAGALHRNLLWTVVLVLAIGFCYSAPPLYLKRRAPTSAFTGMALVLLTYCAALAAHGGPGWTHREAALGVFAAGAVLWVGLIGCPTKDLSDVAGDIAAGRRTIPARYGEAAARRGVAAVALGLALAFCAVAALVDPLLLWPGAGLLVGASAMAVVCLGGFAEGARARRRLPYRVFMTTQYLMQVAALAGLTVRFLPG